MHADLSMLLSAGGDVLALWAAALWRASWQGGLALLLAWAVTRWWRRMPPLLRVWVWRAAYLKLLLALCWPGAVTVPAPPVHLPSPPRLTQIAAPEELPASTTTVTSTAPSATVAPATTSTPPSPLLPPAGPSRWQQVQDAVTAAQPYWPAAFALLWLVGVAWGCGSLALAMRQTGRLRRNSAPVTDAAVQDLLRELAGALGLCRPPELRASTSEGPLLLGPWHAVIIIPAPLLTTGDREALRLMLAHELAHLRQRDLHWGWLTAGLELLFFFHPLVRLGARAGQLAQEMACDALAVRATATTRAAYGAMLTDTAAACAHYAQPTLVAVGMSESFRTLQQRLLAMKHWTSFTRKQLAVIGISISVLAIAVIVPWRLAAQAVEGELISVEEPNGITATANLKDGSIHYYRQTSQGERQQVYQLSGPTFGPEHMLANAITMGDPALVKALLAQKPAWLTTIDSAHGLPLQHAVFSQVDFHGPPAPFDQAGVVTVLLDAGADPNAKTIGYGRPLFDAAANGLLPVVTVLVEHGAQVVDITTRDGDTPRYLALEYGHDDVAAYLKAHGGKVLLAPTPLLEAVSEGDLPTVQRLLTENPACNTADAFGHTPLTLAITCGQRDIANLLVTKDIGIAQFDPDHNTPLHLACRRGDLDMVHLLLKHRAQVDARGSGNMTPLQACAYIDYRKTYARERIVALLLEHGADPNTTDDNGESLLHNLARGGEANLAVLLLEHGANVNARDHSGMTPLFDAVSSGQLGMVEILLSHGADAKATDKFGSPLVQQAKDKAILKLLTKHGASIQKERRVAQMQITPNGGRLVVLVSERIPEIESEEDCRQRFLAINLATGQIEQRYTIAGSAMYTTSLSLDGKALEIFGPEEEILAKRWDLDTGRITTFIKYGFHNAHLLADGIHEWVELQRPNGANVPLAKATIILAMHDRSSGRFLRQLPPMPGSFILYCDHDRKGVTDTGTFDNNTRLCSNVVYHFWDLQTGKELRSIPGGDGATMRYVVSQDGTRLIAPNRLHSEAQPGEGTDTLTAWNLHTGAVINRLDVVSDSVFRLSPSGTLLAVRTPKSDLFFWEIASGKIRCRLPNTTNYNQFIFTPDSTRLITSTSVYEHAAQDSGTIKVWDVHTGELLKSIAIPKE